MSNIIIIVVIIIIIIINISLLRLSPNATQAHHVVKVGYEVPWTHHQSSLWTPPAEQ